MCHPAAMGLWDRLTQGLKKTQEQVTGRIEQAFQQVVGEKLDEDTEERLEEAHAMAKADDVRVQDQAEIASALVLGIKLQQTVGQEGFGVFQPRPQ